MSEIVCRNSCRRGRMARSLLFGAIVAAAVALPALHAQESSGGLYGAVGMYARDAGAQVVIRNVNTNATQRRKPDASGKYAISGLSPGEYEIALVSGEQTVASTRAVVRPGSSTAVAQLDGRQAAATDLGEVKVTARGINNATDNTAPIDVSTPELVRQYSQNLFRKTGVDTSGNNGTGGPYSNLLTALPQQFMSQVASQPYGGSGYASFGGGSGTETRYYVNEFDTTFDYNGAGANMVPGEMIGYATVIANGASAKYSNVMGGSVSAATKSGDNTWRAGFSSYIVPPYSRLLRRHTEDYALIDADGNRTWFLEGGSATNGQQQTAFNNTFWVSGPLVQDRLFVNLAYQDAEPASRSRYMYGSTLGYFAQFMHTYHNPAATLTWNITENQTLDLVVARNKTKDYTTIWKLETPGDPQSSKDYFRNVLFNMKEDFYVGRYRWHMNDSMDLSLMGGYFTHSQQNLFTGSDIFAQRISHDSAGKNIYNVLSDGSPDSETPFQYSKRGFRADWVWQLGAHKIGAGAEHYGFYENNQSTYGKSGHYTYFDYAVASPSRDDVSGIAIPANTPYLRSFVSYYGGPLTQVNRGTYVEDYWQALDDLVVYAGVRRDNNQSMLDTGQRALNFWTTSPRFGLSWDVRGDSSMKAGFTYGLYSMAVPGVILDNALNDSMQQYTYYTYAGIHADGTPVDPRQFGSYTVASKVSDPRVVASRNIKTSQQQNIGLYFQDNGTFPNWSQTVELNYSNVKRAISAWRDLSTPGHGSAAERYLRSLGDADPHIDNVVLVNPGRDLVLTNDFDHDGTLKTVVIPAWASGLPKPKRKAYTFVAEMVHPETPEQPFFLQASYTWKHVWGNYEGYYAEGDPASNMLGSQVFQYAALTQGASGNLPQDIRHAFVLNTAHTFGSSGFSAGLGVNWQSGANKSCYSQYPILTDAASTAGEHAYYCGGVAVSRGSLGRLPSWWLLNANTAWEHAWGPHRLRLEFNIGNLLNKQTLVFVDPYYGYYNGSTLVRENRYGGQAYLAPRSASFAIRYNWN
ncbi:TonB-dependent receptor [Xanthomonas albilineans]|uniref:TonB-dependent receptor n=1 Tax=Xanthomonas albilineans TaxID=29447 RepID=UPI000B2CCC73|nr:TonB-dependent receptor [Xanthomonas albilineans]